MVVEDVAAESHDDFVGGAVAGEFAAGEVGFAFGDTIVD